jgi:hypothetical protein
MASRSIVKVASLSAAGDPPPAGRTR